jgi:uncharacterized protein
VSPKVEKTMNDAPMAMPAALADLRPDRWTTPFWEAARRHELVIARCAACGVGRMPPRPRCWNCQAEEVTWRPSGGTGSVHSFTVARQSFHGALNDFVPYVIVVVELDDSPDTRLISNVVGRDPADVFVGMRVQVHWDDVDESTTVPRFVASDVAGPETGPRAGVG